MTVCICICIVVLGQDCMKSPCLSFIHSLNRSPARCPGVLAVTRVTPRCRAAGARSVSVPPGGRSPGRVTPWAANAFARAGHLDWRVTSAWRGMCVDPPGLPVRLTDTKHLLSAVSTYIHVYASLCLSMSISIYLSICLSIYLYTYTPMSMSISIYLCIYLSIYLYIDMYICISISLSVYLYLHLSFYLSSCLSICLSISF